MNAVVFYSNTGASKELAAYFSNRLDYPFIAIEEVKQNRYENLVLVFPVHCQNIPAPVKNFLRTAKIENLTAIATYGKMYHGNVLWEIRQKYHENIVAAAYLPTKHAYIEKDDEFSDFGSLEQIVEKIKNPSSVRIPKLYKNPLSDLFPKLRSRLGLKIYTTESCDGCDVCAENCPLNGIKKGVTNGNCIRCLRCVEACPRQALKVKVRLPLKTYLRKKKVNRTIIYL